MTRYTVYDTTHIWLYISGYIVAYRAQYVCTVGNSNNTGSNTPSCTDMYQLDIMVEIIPV